MKNFTVAFPLNCSREQAPEFLKALRIDVSKKQVMIPGATIFFTPTLQGAAAGLETLFAEHSPLSEDEMRSLAGHGSLFFLEFSVRNFAEFESFLTVAKNLLNAGALGIYVENSGAAFAAKTALELIDGDVSMEAFVNFVRTSDTLWTLGLEPFGLPDLCVSLQKGEDVGRELLISAADAIFAEGLDYSSGKIFKDDDAGEFRFQKETSSPFGKNAPERNALGYVRLIGKTA